MLQKTYIILSVFRLFKYLLFLDVGPIERYHSGKCFGLSWNRSMLTWHTSEGMFPKFVGFIQQIHLVNSP